MGILDAIQTGLSELFSHKLRSALTMLGVIFGVAAVIAMVSIGEGAKQEALDQIRQMGIDVVHVKRTSIDVETMKDAEEKSPFGLKHRDWESLREVCSFAKQIVPVREVFADVRMGETPIPLKVVGTTPGYDKVIRAKMEKGRFLRDADVNDALPVCVLGAKSKRKLFGFDDAIGKTVKINRRIFRVVGVFQSKEIGSAKSFSAVRNLDSDIYIPLSIAIGDFQISSQTALPSDWNSLRRIARRMMTRQSHEKSQLSEIIVQVEDDTAAVPSAHVIKSVIDRQHKGIPDYEIIIPAELLRQSQETQRIFNIVMAAIASISLLVGGIGIMNIMLATVTQRTREIGIRRCIGATRWDIVRQFMLEALVITCVGGLIGVALGIGGARAIALYADWRTLVSMQAVILSFGVSAIVGVVFGMYPAVRASMVDPIEALRYS